jgi:partner of Y14 and mago protein
MATTPSNSGIITDSNSGERHIPESVRADGTTRKAIKIRPGYRPPEDVEVYKNRAAETFRTRGSFVPGAEGLKEAAEDQEAAASAASNKNAKRREARKKAKAASQQDESSSAGPPAASNGQLNGSGTGTASAQADESVDAEAEKEKKARNLKKKLKQAKELKVKKETGESLLPEQFAKVIKINELIRELDQLGFDAEGEPKGSGQANGKVVKAADT